jgi:hypothetical protein
MSLPFFAIKLIWFFGWELSDAPVSRAVVSAPLVGKNGLYRVVGGCAARHRHRRRNRVVTPIPLALT